jgi:hypothetical protein
MSGHLITDAEHPGDDIAALRNEVIDLKTRLSNLFGDDLSEGLVTAKEKLEQEIASRPWLSTVLVFTAGRIVGGMLRSPASASASS